MLRLLNTLGAITASLRTVRVPSLALATVLYMCAPSSQAQNLLANHGFEDGLTGWTAVTTRAGTAEASSVAHDGLGSALVTVPSQMPGSALIYQDVRVYRGARYCLSAWLQPVAQGGGFGLSVWSVGAYPVEMLAYGTASEWGWQRACFVTPGQRVRVYVIAVPGLVSGGGYVDSMALVPD